jgi:hypothetical protein
VQKKLMLISCMLILAFLAACQPNLDEPVDSRPDQIAPTQGAEENEPPNAGVKRGKVYIEEAQLLVMESYPVQISLHLKGELPTPCNKLQVDIADPDTERKIYVDVYSLFDPEVICVQMTKPFEESFPIPMQGKKMAIIGYM